MSMTGEVRRVDGAPVHASTPMHTARASVGYRAGLVDLEDHEVAGGAAFVRGVSDRMRSWNSVAENMYAYMPRRTNALEKSALSHRLGMRRSYVHSVCRRVHHFAAVAVDW